MDATTLVPADWAALATAIHRSVVVGPVTVIVALSLAFVVSRLPRPTRAPSDWYARSDPAQAPPGGDPCSVDEPEVLSRGGFSPAEVVALRTLRRRVLAGEVSERPAGDDRLAFARWLVERGRLLK